jgi:hypothetical protein
MNRKVGVWARIDKTGVWFLWHHQCFNSFLSCLSVPEAPPVNVRAEPLTSTAVQVWWKPPDPQKINGINQGYKLQAWKGRQIAV